MCGLIGVAGTLDSAYEVFLGLMNLQHRGQDGAGILTLDHKKHEFTLQKGSGLVENVFSERTFRTLRGYTSIGHTRYATIGRRDPNMLQPFLDNAAGIAIAHNGNIVNCYELKEQLHAKDPELTFATESDSEIILKVIAEHLGEKDHSDANLFDAISKAMDRLVGAYSIVAMTKDGSLIGFRDPDGVRPLEFGKKETADGKGFALASESVALDYLGYTETEEIGAGEAIIIKRDGEVVRKVLKKRSYSPCMFEWVYFARVESDMGGSSVYDARFRLGLILAEEIKRRGIEADLVMPVPETSRIAAIALAEAMNLPFRELLIKNRYVNRTFILEDQQSRQEAIRRKLFPIASHFEGKRCLIVDDSIVRGNTAIQIVKLIRQSGAKEVIVVSTCPPIHSPCYYGIDFPSPEELIANNKTESEIAAALGADKVVYQTVEGLQRALQQPSMCTGCLTSTYPTDVSHGEHFQTKRTIDRKKQEIVTS
ncbi:MAG TPA: amidophosphoribosyltransferase [Candidatus Obscuribacterales bacterium]